MNMNPLIPVKFNVKGNEPEAVLTTFEVMNLWKKKHCYEVAFVGDEPVVLYGDLDVEVKNKTREEFEKLDDEYRVALKTHIGSHTFALASGSNYEAEKISWRFYIPDLIGTAQAQKEHIENINKQRLITLPDGTPVKLDCSVYHKGRKMRMLHAWKQIKDNEGNLVDDISKWEQRPLRLVEGLEQYTILHNIREDAEVMKSKIKKIVPLHQDDYEIWKRLVLECWSDERANDYVPWRNGIWAIKSVENNEKGLELAHAFSGRSYKYSERETNNVWREGQGKITGKSIHYWARQDNPVKYAEITEIIPIEFLEKNLNEGDEGLGNIFAKAFEGSIVSLKTNKRDTHYWAFSSKNGLWGEVNNDYVITLFTEHMKNVCMPLYNKLKHECSELGDDDEGKAQKKKLEAQMNLISSMNKTSTATRCMPQIKTKIAVQSEWEEKLFNDTTILPVANGVLCLKTGTLRPYDLEDYLTFKLTTTYDENADTTRQKEFVSQLVNNDKIAEEFLQYWFGYSITGENNRQELVIEEGTPDGSNAKSHWNNCLSNVLGRLYTTGDRKAFSTKPDGVVNNDSLYDARFSRVVVINELNKDDSLDAGQIKNYTGSEPVSVSAKFKNQITYTPKFKIILPLNDMIKVPADAGALWRRIVMLQFKVRFLTRDHHEWCDALHKQGLIVERDDKKANDLKNDKEGWLKWLVEGAMQYYKDPAKKIPASLQEHILQTQEENDPYLKFVRKEYMLDSGSYTFVKELTNAIPVGKDLTEKQHVNRIGATMKKLKIKQSNRIINKESKKVWAGIRKKTQEELDAEE
jgi:P4 family phage/plasmid primase-like protien